MRIHFARPLLAHIKREFCRLFNAWKPRTQEVEFYWRIQNPKFLGWRWCQVLCRAWTLRQLSDWFDLKLSPELGRTGRRLIGWFARFCSSLGRACVSLILIDLQSVFFFPNAHTVKEKVSSGLTVIVEASFGDMTLYGSKLFRTNYSMFFCPSYSLF